MFPDIIKEIIEKRAQLQEQQDDEVNDASNVSSSSKIDIDSELEESGGNKDVNFQNYESQVTGNSNPVENWLTNMKTKNEKIAILPYEKNARYYLWYAGEFR